MIYFCSHKRHNTCLTCENPCFINTNNINMKIAHLLLLGSCSLTLFSCVSSKKFKAEQAKNVALSAQYAQTQASLKTCEDDKAEAARKKTSLEAEIDGLNK